MRFPSIVTTALTALLAVAASFSGTSAAPLC